MPLAILQFAHFGYGCPLTRHFHRKRTIPGMTGDGKDRHKGPARRRLSADRRGTALIELAITLPVLLLLVCGIISYGSWIALGHAVQQSANEAARAAIAGLTQQERSDIAAATARMMLRESYKVTPDKVVVTVDDDGVTLIVEVRYDASANPLLTMPIVPSPGTRIERKTAIRITQL